MTRGIEYDPATGSYKSGEDWSEEAVRRADLAAERAAALASKGKTDEALVMALLAIEARLEVIAFEVSLVPQ